MSTYLDSGALVKLYVAEPGSEEVQTQARKADQLLLTPFQLLELRTALRAAAGRGLLTAEAVRATLAHLDEDIDSGCYDILHPDWTAVLETAEDVSAAHTEDLLCRTLDILHVAIALQEGASLFVTGDKRQAALAARLGLTVYPINSR